MKFKVPAFKYEKQESTLRRIKIVPTKEKLTAASGLGTIVEMFDQSGLRDEFIKCLPKRKSNRSIGSYKLGLSMICGFIHGFDCLDDFEHLTKEHALNALFDEELPAARTLGDFLRSFTEEDLKALLRSS